MLQKLEKTYNYTHNSLIFSDFYILIILTNNTFFSTNAIYLVIMRMYNTTIV